MEPVTTTALALSALQALKEVMKMFPSYDQRKAEQYEKELMEYERQKTLPMDHPDRNDDLLLNLRTSLQLHVGTFSQFVKSQSKAK